MYAILCKMEFPAPATTSHTFKKQLLNCQRRSLQTKDLFQPASGARRRVKFNASLVQDYPWFMMGNIGGFCIYCKLFANSPSNAGELTAKPYLSFSKKAIIREHEQKSYHCAALSRVHSFKNVCNGILPDSTGYCEEKIERQKRLIVVIKTLLFVARHSLSFGGPISQQEPMKSLHTARNGHILAKGDVNRGNVLDMLALQDTGDADIGTILNDRACYTSPTIQNELLSLMGKQVTSHIVRQVSQTCFSLIADEFADINTAEQLCVAVRYLNKETVTIEERFIAFVDISGITGTCRLSQNTIRFDLAINNRRPNTATPVAIIEMGKLNNINERL